MNPRGGRYRSSLNLEISTCQQKEWKKTNSNTIDKDKIKLEIKSKI